ncbi:hypothetical protein CkaCkLH20_12626 [Colletotrichum karsti]|uniref:Uncharacterized protein n=1 Tax=Colletotrichum karsti TaxID=1095194 RepID=A0A9P6HTJ8_9PEZI|nr:uncharacterized protein CkaCkLH20_12626 [Colletotrichum karsti]KAF9869919.1 hypothetical protein CkaCkLH20_12626 [Colletotrichum karsti]
MFDKHQQDPPSQAASSEAYAENCAELSADDSTDDPAPDHNDASSQNAASDDEACNDECSDDAMTDDSAEHEDERDVLSLDAISSFAEEEIDRMFGARTSIEITTLAVKLLRATSQDYISKIFATADMFSRHSGRDIVALRDLRMAQEVARLWGGQQHSEDRAATEISRIAPRAPDPDHNLSTSASAYDDGVPSSSLGWVTEEDSMTNYATRSQLLSSIATSSAGEEVSMSDVNDDDPETNNVDMSSIDGNISDPDPYKAWFPSYEESSHSEDEPASNAAINQQDEGEAVSS